MLEKIKVKNIALISEAEICPGRGLNILTGETGAGKSILIDSIFLALGARADRGLIRQGADHAYVELSFNVEDKALAGRLSEIGADIEDGRIILTRRLEKDRNICRINGEVVSGKVLRSAGKLLMDIHSQQEHTELLSHARQLDIVDQFCGKKAEKARADIKELYDRYCDVLRELDEAKSREGSRERDIDLYRYELSEIDAASLVTGEDEELEIEFQRLSNLSRIRELTLSAGELIDSADSQSALAMVGNAIADLKDAQRFDESLGEYADILLDAEENLRDVARKLSRYAENCQGDEERFSEVSLRLDVINRLKTKYGKSIESILAYADEKRELLQRLEDFGQYVLDLENRKEDLKAKLLLQCSGLSGLRKKGGRDFAGKISAVLGDLGFEHVEFEVRITGDEKFLSDDGYDRVCFMISLNAGQEVKPLDEVASGGELSRIMLAVRTLMADTDAIPTLIFDEIDAGISGQTAWKVSEKMAVIGRKHQLICITHLPQIAAMADHHFRIEKSQGKKDTRTDIDKLSGEGMIGEIARLLGSDEITESALDNAGELKRAADGVKEKIALN